MRNKIVAGNWKMNTTPAEGKALVLDVLKRISNFDLSNKLVVFGAPMVSLTTISKVVGDQHSVYVASQNVSEHDHGAYTGETSAKMVAGTGAKMAIIGHSERREYFLETNALLALKVDQSMSQNLIPIYCCGEVLEDRMDGTYNNVIKTQVEEGLFHLNAEAFKMVVIAYEPVWAIGTGETATPEQAQEVHAFIRGLVADKYGAQIADDLSILYGGSMKPGNASQLMDMNDIDGGLIGGAALKADDFVEIIKAM